jgi:hypothetical protein
VDRFITQAEADRMRAQAMGLYQTVKLDRVDWLRMPGVAGVLTVDYYVVPDGDPRLQLPDLAPQPDAGA